MVYLATLLEMAELCAAVSWSSCPLGSCHADRVIIDCVKVGRSPCLNAFKRGPCVNIDFLLNPREYWPLIGQSGFKSSCSDGWC